MSSKFFNRARDSSNVHVTDYDRLYMFFTHASMCPCAACVPQPVAGRPWKGTRSRRSRESRGVRKRRVDDTGEFASSRPWMYRSQQMRFLRQSQAIIVRILVAIPRICVPTDGWNMFLDVVWTQPPSTCFVQGLKHTKMDLFRSQSYEEDLLCTFAGRSWYFFCMHYKKPKEHDLHV